MGNAVIEDYDVKNLLLDKDNPRLPESVQGGTQKEILRFIAKNEAVEDLMSAIAKNGYFAGEPLIIYRNDEDAKGKMRVIEGNRRLASVQLLRDPDLYPERPSLAEIAASAPKKHKPDLLPAVCVDSRDDALPYLGSRHIVGVKSWEPLQKARYMNQLFATTAKSAAPTARYRDVASKIGSGKRRDFIKRNLDALAVYDQMSDADFYGDESMDETTFSFGVLYSALAWKPIAGYLGVVSYDAEKDTVKKEADPIVNPGALKKERVKDLYRWCFKKDESGRTVLGESRNLPKLAAVLKSQKAVSILKSRNDLNIAYEKSGGVEQELLTSLGQALKELRYSNSIVANVEYEQPLDDLANDVNQQAGQIALSIKAKKKGS